MVAASISKGAGTPGKLTRANDQQISMQIAARQGHRTNGCPKNASRCPKNASQTILQLQTLRLKQETNGRWMLAAVIMSQKAVRGLPNGQSAAETSVLGHFQSR